MESNDDQDATPAVPLDYFEKHQGPWQPVVRWAAWMVIAYATIEIASAVPTLLRYILPGFTRARSSFAMLNAIIFVLLCFGVDTMLIVSANMVLRRARLGRVMLIWSCAGSVACTLILFALNVYKFGLFRSTSNFWGVALYQFFMQFFTFLRDSLVPVVMILFFRRREVRDVIS